jgi:putative phosphoserine phosphatase / 1-acylglycerol-3-phosphate O-acyltransferase
MESIGVATPRIPGQDLFLRIYDLFGESKTGMQLAKSAASRSAGLRPSDVRSAGQQAVEELLAKVQPYVRQTLVAHRERGDLLVLATTSPFDLVTPFAKALGFDAVVATKYKALDGKYTGEVDGGFVWGEGKLAAVQAWAETNNVSLGDSAAYSDSFFDSPLLDAVGRPNAINPDARLFAASLLRGWPVRWLDAPTGVPRVLGVEPLDVLRRLIRPELIPYARFEFNGVSNIPRTGPVIVVANHRSYFDPLAIALLLAKAGRNGRFMAKREVVDVPVIGQIIRAFGTIRVDRGAGSSQPLDEAVDALRGGEVVVILPQGTIPRGEAFFDPKLEGRPGAARLAAMTGAPVVPVGLWGTEQVWPRNAKIPNITNVTNSPKVQINVGKPVKKLKLTPAKAATSLADTASIMRAISDLLPAESKVKRQVSEADLRKTQPTG